MGELFDTIRQLVAEEKHVVGEHASERLEERGIMEWQVVAAVAAGGLAPAPTLRDHKSRAVCNIAHPAAGSVGVTS